jgi:hypothetical protein
LWEEWAESVSKFKIIVTPFIEDPCKDRQIQILNLNPTKRTKSGMKNSNQHSESSKIHYLDVLNGIMNPNLHSETFGLKHPPLERRPNLSQQFFILTEPNKLTL